jgi:hypothetical protein
MGRWRAGRYAFMAQSRPPLPMIAIIAAQQTDKIASDIARTTRGVLSWVSERDAVLEEDRKLRD